MNLDFNKLSKLAENAKNGDVQSIEILYSECYDEVFYTCYKILGSRENAEDISQDTFIEAFTSINNLNDTKSFGAWLKRIAVNKSINFLKKTNRIAFQPPETIGEILDSEDINTSPEDIAIDSDVKATLDSIIAKLPEEQRRVMFLFYYEEMTTREIAEIYGCPESTIKSRLTYARKFMRKEVEKLEDKGYKLRCIAALPFIFALFKAEKYTVPISGKTNIVSVLNSGNNLSAAANSNETNNFSGKIGMSKSVKNIIAVISAGIVAVGGITAAVLLKGSNNNVNVDNSEISSYVSNSENSISENSISESSITVKKEDSSESSLQSKVPEESNLSIKWNLKKMSEPKLKDSEYTTIGDSITAKPPIEVDVEAAKKLLREHPKLSKLAFADEEKEENFITYNNQLLGYTIDPQNDSKPKSQHDSSVNLRFCYSHTANIYDAPENYSLVFKGTELSQNEIYEITKSIFGEELSKYMVYAENSGAHSIINENDMSNSLQTPNKKGHLLIERVISEVYLGSGSEKGMSIGFFLTFNDSNVKYYRSSHERLEWPMTLSDFFQKDLGNVSLDTNNKNFFDKLFGFGGRFDPYEQSFITGESIENIYYSDESVYSAFSVSSRRLSETTEENKIQGSIKGNISDQLQMNCRNFSINSAYYKNKDGSIDLEELKIILPTTYYISEENNVSILDEMSELSKQQVCFALGIDKKLFENAEEDNKREDRFSSRAENTKKITLKNVPVQICGQETNVEITITAFYQEGNDVYKAEYYSTVKIVNQK